MEHVMLSPSVAILAEEIRGAGPSDLPLCMLPSALHAFNEGVGRVRSSGPPGRGAFHATRGEADRPGSGTGACPREAEHPVLRSARVSAADLTLGSQGAPPTERA